MRRAAHVILLVTSSILIFDVPIIAEEPRSGHIDWGQWSFNWEVKDNAGLTIRNVTFKNELVLYKASNPVTRVKYVKDHCGWPFDNLSGQFPNCGGCGPYADHIDWAAIQPTTDPFGIPVPGGGTPQKVHRASYQVGGVNWFEIGVFAEIGAYQLYQAWYLTEDGQIQVRMFSRGLSCYINHTHHVYWRMDFDINGAPFDQIFVWDGNRPNEGWGPGWHKYTKELNDRKSPSTGRVWFIRDNPTRHGAWLFPGEADGTSDGFSAEDIGARLYHYQEDEPWPFNWWGDLGYNNGEDIQEKDIVFWYVSHLFHDQSQGGAVWHSSGPTLVVERGGGGPQPAVIIPHP